MNTKAIKQVVKEFNALCKNSEYKKAGELARFNKQNFIQMIKHNGASSLEYAYRVCPIFNMRQTDCFNLVF